MNKVMNGYANYGVLAHEKQVRFTISNPHPHAVTSDKVAIEIPDDWQIDKNMSGEILLINSEGVVYLADEVVRGWGDNAVLEWYDGSKGHRIELKWWEI